MPPRFLIPTPSGGTAGPFRKMNTLSLPVRLLRRAVLLALMMFLLSVVVFVFARLAPGDPLQSFYGDSLEQMTDAEKAAASACPWTSCPGEASCRWPTGRF